MKGEPPVTRLPSYARGSPKIPVYAQASSPASAPARRGEDDERRMTGGGRGRSLGFDDASTRVHIHTPRRSRRADTRDTRFVLFPSSHSRRQIFLEFVSGRLRPTPGRGSQKDPTLPSPLQPRAHRRSAPRHSARRFASFLLLQLREKAVSRRENSTVSIGGESRRARLTIAARSTVRDRASQSLPARNRS